MKDRITKQFEKLFKKRNSLLLKQLTAGAENKEGSDAKAKRR